MADLLHQITSYYLILNLVANFVISVANTDQIGSGHRDHDGVAL
jgi:hypothetical protein